jgi:hypothetical protein
MARNTINDNDREDFVNNDEGLYRLWQASKQGITTFVRQNRPFIDEVIRKVRDGEKPAHYLFYGDGR